MEIGNQMQNHKIETNSERELIYEDGSIWLTLIFIKIIGSDTLWFPLPPSEVLDIVNEIKWYLTFFAPPQGTGTKIIVPLNMPLMWVTHTPNLVDFQKN